jgi:hypothetical protein
MPIVVDRTSPNQCLWILGLCVKEKVTIIKVGIVSLRNQAGMTTNAAKQLVLEHERIGAITLPAINANINDIVHLFMPPSNSIWIRI